MTEILKLDDDLVNKIKAGEVVERPYNVVKECIENSIDAGCTSLTVEIYDGGKNLIKIQDDGCGIPKNDLALACERHATSKIKEFSDLSRLSSFGFRGEALASIQSVAKMTIRSRTKHDKLATQITFENGQMREELVPGNVGTFIQVKELFYNIPARQKFLKTTATEYSHVHDFLTSMAFCHPHISFHFFHNGRQVFQYIKRDNSSQRFQDITKNHAENYAKIDFEKGSFRCHGFVSLPEKTTAIPEFFYVFVNGRYLKDRLLRSAVLQGYQGLLVKGLQPSVVLSLEMDPSWVDVNVHPSKIEVRFLDPFLIQDYIATTIQDTLKNVIATEVQKEISTPLFTSQDHRERAGAPPLPNRCAMEEKRNPSHFPKQQSPTIFYQNPQATPYNSKPYTPSENQTFENRAPKETESLFPQRENSLLFGAEYIGQIFRCYLLFEKNEKFFVLDQHAFHERVLFEEISQAYYNKNIPKTLMMFPEVFHVNATDSQRVGELIPVFEELGFQVELLQEDSLAVSAHPEFIKTHQVRRIFEALLQKIVGNGAAENATASEHSQIPKHLSTTYHDYFATIACHSAIRSGEELSAELVQRLIRRSADIDFCLHCPHGRPVYKIFPKKDVESWFQRT